MKASSTHFATLGSDGAWGGLGASGNLGNRQNASLGRGASTNRGTHAGGAADLVLPRMVLMLVVLALTLTGMVMIYSASSISAISEESDAASYLFDQIVFAIIGIAAAVVLWKVLPYRRWLGPLFWVFWCISLVLLLLTAFMGTAALGAQRWLSIGPVSMQPSEFAKIIIVIAMVRIVYEFQDGTYEFIPSLMRLAILVIMPVGLLYFSQSDLGTTMIIALGILSVMWFGGIKLRYLLGLVALVFLFACAATFLVGYRSDRLLFLHPWDDGQNGYGNGYQIIHSMYAFAQGGILGSGLGNSREKYLYLPESETDFIFSIIGEELGMVGALAIIIGFLALLWAGLQIARNASDSFGTMLAGALIIMLVFQAFLNMACAMAVFPTTGKPLPFISSGGSSLIASFMMIGIILSVSEDDKTQDQAYDKRREEFRVFHATSRDSAYRPRDTW